jgi:agarase
LVGCGSDGEPRASGVDPTAALSEDACDSLPVRGYGFDRYGGWKGIRRVATGRFRVEQIDGVWWLVTPDGHVLFSNGPTGIDPVGDYIQGTGRSNYLDGNLARYGSREAWAEHTSDRLCALGIRTLGGWMGPADLDRFQGKFPYAVNVDFYDIMPRVRGGPSSLKPRRDVFDPRASELAAALGAEGGMIARCAADPWCIGVYVENEAPYAPSILAGGGHLETYLSMAAGAPGKQALQQFFVARYAGDVAAFNLVWETELASFDELQAVTTLGDCAPLFGHLDDICYLEESAPRIADRYDFEAHVAGHLARLADATLHAANPQMLNLGPRIVVSAFAPQVLQALAGPADVMSVNNYDVQAYAEELLTAAQRARLAELNFLSFDPFGRLEQLAAITGKPLLVTEWFYRRARPTGSFPPILPEVPDGAAQAAAYRRYKERLLAMPYVVGEHWFQWVDQPIEGRGDGENQLIGIVDIDDRLNQPLADTVAEINRTIIERRVTR